MIKGHRKNLLSNHTFDSILGEGMVIDGRLKVSGSVLIHETVTGDIEADKNSSLKVVGVGETGVVCGSITAHQLMIGDKIQGDVTALSRLEMMSTGLSEENLKYGALVIDEGGRVMDQMIPILESKPGSM